jgi:hypothetical protein|tara:strand:+ start:179 stop:361 length:183 start_codon:yes stop_codon:yes gene_type:complete
MENRFNLTAGEMVATIKGKKDANQKMLATWGLSKEKNAKLQVEIDVYNDLLKTFEKQPQD